MTDLETELLKVLERVRLELKETLREGERCRRLRDKIDAVIKRARDEQR